MYNKVQVHPKSEKVKLPFGIDLAVKAKSIMSDQNTFSGRGCSSIDKSILRTRDANLC